MPKFNLDKEFKDIYDRISIGERLSKEDGLKLYKSNDILSIGYLADFAKVTRLEKKEQAQQKDFVYWINNHHLNLTNICEGKCKFCAYRKDSNDNSAFFLSTDKAGEYIKNNVSTNASEIHIVSAINPELNIEYYEKLFRICRTLLPNIHIQALTPVEIDYISKISDLSIEETFIRLKNAGLNSMPGGGAEIFSERIRTQLCPEKISGQKWLEIMEIAHSFGLKSNATMLTGIGETNEEKLDHILALRSLQDKTSGFMSFIPLLCHYENTELSGIKPLSGYDILKNYAISRLMLDNIDHIKAFWIQVGKGLAQVSLAFGADDLDGTVVKEKISHSAGAGTGTGLTENDLVNIIKASGKIAVERDTVYNILSEYNGDLQCI